MANTNARLMKRIFMLALLGALGAFVATAVAQSSTWPKKPGTTTKTVPGRTTTVTQTTTTTTETTKTTTTTTTTAPVAQPVNRAGPVAKGTAFQWGLMQSDPQYRQQLLARLPDADA